VNCSYYAGGGGGGIINGTRRPGGTGGGGTGGLDNSCSYTSACAGTPNTGGGGGGTGYNYSQSITGGTGGSGIVIIRYSGSQKGTGGTITSSGGYTYHKFTSSGTMTF
jgi:hypothetical protein